MNFTPSDVNFFYFYFFDNIHQYSKQVIKLSGFIKEKNKNQVRDDQADEESRYKMH